MSDETIVTCMIAIMLIAFIYACVVGNGGMK